MVKNDGLGVLGTPVLVENPYVVVGRDKAHGVFSFWNVVGDRHCGMRGAQRKGETGGKRRGRDQGIAAAEPQARGGGGRHGEAP